MNEKIMVRNGNGVPVEILAIDIMGTSPVQKEENRSTYHFIVLKQGGKNGWKISDFTSEEEAEVQRVYVESEFARIMSN